MRKPLFPRPVKRQSSIITEKEKVICPRIDRQIKDRHITIGMTEMPMVYVTNMTKWVELQKLVRKK